LQLHSASSNFFCFLLIPGALPHCRGVLRRTERSTVREGEAEQKQRPKIRETRVSNQNLFLFYKAPLLSPRSTQGARFNPISVHQLTATLAVLRYFRPVKAFICFYTIHPDRPYFPPLLARVFDGFLMVFDGGLWGVKVFLGFKSNYRSL
jgi:hypothetical protein